MLIKWRIVKELEDFLNCSQAMLIGLIVLNFLTFGNLTNLTSFLNNIRRHVENRVWGKYINIDEKIATNEAEIDRLSNQIIKN